MRARPYLPVRRHSSLIVSAGLVLVIGALGLVAGHAAGEQAREVHREDRLRLQVTLAGLVAQHKALGAAELADALRTGPAWPVAWQDSQSVARLEQLVVGVRAVDVGAVLLDPLGQPLAAWSEGGALPDLQDEGWWPLRSALLGGNGSLALSGVMTFDDRAVLGMGRPVPLSDGTTGMVVGLWDARSSALQQYVSALVYDETGHGYVVDGRGLVLAGPERDAVGQVLPVAELTRSGTGIVDTEQAGKDLVVSYAQVGMTGWTALTSQDQQEFEGALLRASRLVEAAVVALLLIASGALVLMHRRREAALRRMAMHDELTGLHNRRGWFHLAEHELERGRRQSSERVLLFVDLDGLKQVNDVLGHREGDQAIRAAAAVLASATRASDVVGRIGGDEFVLLLGEGGRADVAQRRVVQALAEHERSSTAPFELRLSIGVTVWSPESTCCLDELVRRADAQMYAHKSSRSDRSVGVVRAARPGGSGAAAA